MNYKRISELCTKGVKQVYESKKAKENLKLLESFEKYFPLQAFCSELFNENKFKINNEWVLLNILGVHDFFFTVFSFISFFTNILFLRRFLKEKTLQDGISALFGLYAIFSSLFNLTSAIFGVNFDNQGVIGLYYIFWCLYIHSSITLPFAAVFNKASRVCSKYDDYDDYDDTDFSLFFYSLFVIGGYILILYNLFEIHHFYTLMFLVKLFGTACEVAYFSENIEKRGIFYLFFYIPLSLSSFVPLVLDLPPYDSTISSKAIFAAHNIVLPYFFYKTWSMSLKEEDQFEE